MAKAWGLKLQFSPDIFGALSKDEQIFLLQNLTEFPSYVKAAFNVSPEEFLRFVFRGPVKVSSNCPFRSIFHDWTVNIVQNPDEVNFCKSAAIVEQIYKTTNPFKYSPSTERQMEILIDESCYNYASYAMFDNAVSKYIIQTCKYADNYQIASSKSLGSEKDFYYSMLHFVHAKTYNFVQVNELSRKIQHLIGESNGDDINYPEEELDSVRVYKVDFLLKKFHDIVINAIASGSSLDYEQIRALAACEFLYETFGSRLGRMRRTVTALFGDHENEINEIKSEFDEVSALKELDYNRAMQ